MKLADQLCFAIYNTNRLFNQFYAETLDDYQLTYPQYLVLLTLWEHDNQRLRDLAQQLNLESNTLTPLLKRLEAHGWLTRVHSTRDRRQLYIQLTPKGKAAEQPITHKITSCVMDQLDLSLADYRQMLADQTQLATQLQTYLQTTK